MARSNQSGATPQPQEGLTVIGAQIVVNGRVEGEEDLRVEGRVEGSIALSQTLYVETDGIVVAEVKARDIVVAGIVIGNVTAENCITLHAGARLVGDLAAPRVVIEDGAAFRGNVAMGAGGPGASKGAAGAAKRPSRAPARATTNAKGTPKTAAKPVAKANKPARAAATARAVGTAKAEAAQDRPRVAPIRARDDDEVTVVVRHAEVAARPKGGDAESGAAAKTAKKAAKKKAKKAPPRARMPKPGKRRISRR